MTATINNRRTEMTKAKMKKYEIEAYYRASELWEGDVVAPEEDPREVIDQAISDHWPDADYLEGEFELHKVWVNGKKYDYYGDENLFGKNGGSN